MNNSNWKPVVHILVDEERDYVASRIVATFDADPSIIAGMMISMLDMFVSKIPEQKQTQFEKEIVSMFNNGLEERFKFLDREKYDDN